MKNILSIVCALGLMACARTEPTEVNHSASRPACLECPPDHQATAQSVATTIDSSALLVYSAAWQRDQGRNVTREAAMAKMVATDGAQQVIDSAVQLFGGLGVTQGQMVESLYRVIRSLRIYEGATEVQLLIIARELLRDASPKE